MVNYLILFNLIFFLATVLSGGFTISNLLRLGAKYGPLVAYGEWQRLIICIFLHGNLWHLLFNSYALYQLGHLVEEIFGQRKFLGIYFLCGLSGSVFSYFLNYQQVGVGASGAIFGLAGTLFAGGMKHRNTPLNRLALNILPFIIINLIIGLAVPTIDNAAHVGGLLCGMLLGWLVPVGVSWRRWQKVVEELAYWFVILLVGFSFLSFFIPLFGSRASTSLDNVIVFHNAFQGFLLKIENGQPVDPKEVSRLVAPDGEARSLQEKLLRFLSGEGGFTLFQEITSEFLKWRENVLRKYQGLIYER